MRVLTVRQPWAWAIVHGGKDVENRSRNIAGSYRGPVAIHAGLTVDEPAKDTPLIDDAWRSRYGWGPASRGLFETGIIVGVVDLVDVHRSQTASSVSYTGQPVCFDDHTPTGSLCSPWALRDHWHLELANPTSFGYLGANPIRAKGRLGLWRPDGELLAAIREQVPA